jgi:putative two-component system response regulator
MKVVIVDDTALNLTLMQALISKVEGCDPTSFASPLAALEYCLGSEPDLLIVDYMMPELDGLEFIRRFRAAESGRDVPILMVTANDQKQVRYDALQYGATDFLNKPIDRNEFQPRVRNMLALRRAHLATRARAEELAEEVRKATAEIQHRERETVTRLARAAEFRDPETGAHIQRMAHFSALIARRLGMDAAYADMLLQAAPMHDVGKLGIPDNILLKPGRLTPEEFEIMRRHAEIGHDILKDSASEVVQMGATIARTHHEKFDGSGYPAGLAGTAIAIEGRICAVADVFDALTSERPYKKAWPVADAVGFLREGSGKHFDPACVDAFLGSWDEVETIRAQFRDE